MDPTWHPSAYDSREWSNTQYHCPVNHNSPQGIQQQNQWQVQHAIWPGAPQNVPQGHGPGGTWSYQPPQGASVIHHSRAEGLGGWNSTVKSGYFTQSAVAVPNGWTRSIQGGQVVYSSPDKESLNSISAVAAYLRRNGTCKCGLPCPLKIEEVFSFDPQVVSAPWTNPIRSCRPRVAPAPAPQPQPLPETNTVYHQVSLQNGQSFLIQQQQPVIQRSQQQNRLQIQGGILSQVSEMKAIMPVAPIMAVPPLALPGSATSGAKSPKKRRRRAAPPQTVASILQRQDPQNQIPLAPQTQMVLSPTFALLPDGRTCIVTSAPGQYVLVPANSMPLIMPVGTQKPEVLPAAGHKSGRHPSAPVQSDSYDGGRL